MLLSVLLQFYPLGLPRAYSEAMQFLAFFSEESLHYRPCLLGHPSRRKNASPYVLSRRQPRLTDRNEMMYSKKCSVHGNIMSLGEGGGGDNKTLDGYECQ